MVVNTIWFDKIENNEYEGWATFKVVSRSPYQNNIVESDKNIFGSITPYKWYEIDKNGYPIVEKPIKEAWNYFVNKVFDLQNTLIFQL